MKKLAAIAGILSLVAGLIVATPQVAKALPPHSHTNTLAIPITASGQGATLNGTFTLTGFAFQNGQVLANGILTGAVTGAASGSVLQTLSIPLGKSSSTTVAPAAAATACSILHLVLGPINLDVLGLTVTTNQIVLDISAIPGAGNLLGNLLCDVANLLNTPNQTLANLLNQIVAILQGL